MKKSMQSNRRNFFQMLSFGAFGALMLEFIPVRFVKKFTGIEEKGKIKAVVHPLAVKRNNKELKDGE